MAHIIQPKHAPWQPDDWSRHLANAIDNVAALLARLQIDPATVVVDPAPDFALRVPEPFFDRIRPRDPDDPLLRQVLPLDAERRVVPGYGTDPLQEAAATRATGLIQKYRGRALLIASPACAVHCRYCFRRHFPYDAHRQDVSFPALAEVERDTSITEVILSGGDPLMLKDSPLQALVRRLERIPHLKRLRVHTRVPVVIPQRVTPAFLALLNDRRLPMTIVLHINHPNEIDENLITAVRMVASTGVTLLNQSVLLAGVNDDAGVLAELSECLHTIGVLPYYLHLPDAVRGTQHFYVSETSARMLAGELSRRLPGYLVPRLARETPGLESKEILSPL